MLKRSLTIELDGDNLNDDKLTTAEPQPKRPKRKHNQYQTLNDDQVNILEQWYLSHKNIVTGPYPTSKDKEELANSANLDIDVVTRWFVSQRANEKAEIKKIWKRGPIIRIPKTILTDAQTSTLNQWYISHRDINNGPYLTEVDKAELAAATNLPVERILKWMKNKRDHETQDIKNTWNYRRAMSSNKQNIKAQTSTIQKNACQVCSQLFNQTDLRKFKDVCGHKYCRAYVKKW